ncbi:hypothetical protein [Amycolatopsis regifaucium]|uniref:Uncharacterized protein n=1 Tax=Amycolatopsis regifaucium TaxID=546365 RepID=A0A154MXC7_9PSEU|nr:hypothetical protein [Amycolatopsis regifaucium]KZB88670.1 hypothetical protein AVL48_00920 [Amycolatopsis regifaucium]OKA07158.1 hypothetical protein ATP06_0214865 [Amycolatopsis regifaucium]SFI55954.1 hypothetical protein SAMN04489731_111183 [Amycolatopsis regifaucium]
MPEFGGLGFDPVPGDADAVADAARRCSEAAAKIEAATAVRIAMPREWEGDAAGTFAARAAAARAALEPAPAVLRATADILTGWAGTVVAGIRRAEQFDRRTVTLRRALTEAADAVERAETTVQFAAGAAAAQAGLAAAKARHEDVRRELDRVLDQARALEASHRAEASRVEERLRALGEPDTALGEAPDGRASFAEVTRGMERFSALGEELAASLARAPGPAVTPPSGAVGAFAAAVSLGGR